MALARPDRRRQHVILGHINGLYGVRGGVRVFSYTRPKQNLFSYDPWLVGEEDSWQQHKLIKGQNRNGRMVAFLDGIDDREQARRLLGNRIAVAREQLPELPEGQFYWHDLMDLEVIDQNGNRLGVVTDIQETGANGVLVVHGTNRQLIPLVTGEIVTAVDLQAGRIHVNWLSGYL